MIDAVHIKKTLPKVSVLDDMEMLVLSMGQGQKTSKFWNWKW